MLRVALAALLALALVPLAPPAGTAPAFTTAEATALETTGSPAPAAAPEPPCAPVPEPRAVATHEYISLRWDACPGVESYQLLRGTTPEGMTPLVEVGHPGHVDIAVEPGTWYWYGVLPMGRGIPSTLQAVPIQA